MKRTPSPRPTGCKTCSIEHDSGNVIDFPMIQDLAALLWVVNLGCIDLNQWYARCDDVDRPDYFHFDLDPGPGAPFAQVLEAALLVRDALDALKMPSYAKTSGSKGLHVYVPIKRGPTQKDVWTFTKALAMTLAERTIPKILTAQYRVAKRPRGRVLVDYNQNAWGRTLASVYSVRPTTVASVSTPVTWDEIERGITSEQFTMDVVLRARGASRRSVCAGAERKGEAALVLKPVDSSTTQRAITRRSSSAGSAADSASLAIAFGTGRTHACRCASASLRRMTPSWTQ